MEEPGALIDELRAHNPEEKREKTPDTPQVWGYTSLATILAHAIPRATGETPTHLFCKMLVQFRVIVRTVKKCFYIQSNKKTPGSKRDQAVLCFEKGLSV